MRKAKDFLGLVVTGQEDGSVLGQVKDLVLDESGQRVSAFVLDEKDAAAEAGTCIIPWEWVLEVGTDAIVVRNGREKEWPIPQLDGEAGHSGRESLGTQVFTAQGAQLGTLKDLLIDPKTGEVKGYEVSGDILRRGRRSAVPVAPAYQDGGQTVVLTENLPRAARVTEGSTPSS